MAAAIWSQKDMRSPSGGKARRRGGTQVGKAPPSPKMLIFGLTRGQVVGEDQSAKIDCFPGSAGRCGPPLRRAVSFLGSCLQRRSANPFPPPRIPHLGYSIVKGVVEGFGGKPSREL